MSFTLLLLLLFLFLSRGVTLAEEFTGMPTACEGRTTMRDEGKDGRSGSRVSERTKSVQKMRRTERMELRMNC